MTDKERIAKLESDLIDLRRLIEVVAFNIVEHTAHIERQIDERYSREHHSGDHSD